MMGQFRSRYFRESGTIVHSSYNKAYFFKSEHFSACAERVYVTTVLTKAIFLVFYEMVQNQNEINKLSRKYNSLLIKKICFRF